jgi:nucleoside-diphosphate-sugar epimerase
VTGAGGFIGHHLVTYLKAEGYWVRGVDRKRPEFAPSDADEFLVEDLREPRACRLACDGGRTGAGLDEVYHLASDMGGMGYIESHKGVIARDNALLDLHLLDAARAAGARRLFYASTACVYPAHRQRDAAAPKLREEDAYPADPEDGYGWQKLYTERLCRHYAEDFGLETRVARFHSVYGPLGTYDGGREKVIAATCRKVALAPDGGEVVVWGDGAQTRTFCYVDDAVEAVHRLMRSDHGEPLNVGSERLVSIDALVAMVAGIAGRRVVVRHDPAGPLGVRGRASDNTRARAVLGWEPRVSLEDGVARTYRWVAGELARRATQGAA